MAAIPVCSCKKKKYWAEFYCQFTRYLFEEKGFYDNYVGQVCKNLKAFFNFLNEEKAISTQQFFKKFYVLKEEIPIICLLPEQLQFLICNSRFHESLSPSLQKSKMIFVFGCTVALRRGDLFAIKPTDLEQRKNDTYLCVKTRKTGQLVRIKLPSYAVEIAGWFSRQARNRSTLFPNIPPSRFNHHIKQIAELAGFTQPLSKSRNKRGIEIPLLPVGNKITNRFCDHLSSHTMRRTAITSMLMLGINEWVVKMLSGHSANSKSFARYVHLAQSYLDTNLEKLNNFSNDQTV